MESITDKFTEIVSTENFNQTKLAEIIGLPRETLNRILHEKRFASTPVLSKIEKFLREYENGADFTEYRKNVAPVKSVVPTRELQEGERWVKGYKGSYAVNTSGQIYSYRSNRFLSPYENSGGYFKVDLKDKSYYIHRIVAEAFLFNPNNLPEINHKNLDKSDNSIENLEWVSHLENIEHYWKHKEEREVVA